MNIFKDVNGNWSSKRIFGGFLVMMGAGLHFSLAVVSFNAMIGDPLTIITSANWLVGFGSGLLGISVLEFLAKK